MSEFFYFSSPCPCSFTLHWPCSTTTTSPTPTPHISSLPLARSGPASNQAFGSFLSAFCCWDLLNGRNPCYPHLHTVEATTFWQLRLFTTEKKKFHESRCQESIDVTLSSHCRPQHLVAPRRYYDTSHVQSFFTSCQFSRPAAALAQREFPVRSLPFFPSSLCISQCCSNATCASHSTSRFQLVGSAPHCRFRPER